MPTLQAKAAESEIEESNRRAEALTSQLQSLMSSRDKHYQDLKVTRFFKLTDSIRQPLAMLIDMHARIVHLLRPGEALQNGAGVLSQD